MRVSSPHQPPSTPPHAVPHVMTAPRGGRGLCLCAGSSEDGPRVVFMVDLWHPNVAAAERQALDYIFTPGRLDDKDGK